MRYTERRKLALLAAAKHLQGEGRLLQSAADKVRVSVANLSRWAVQKINKVNPMDSLFTKKKKVVYPGPFSQLIVIEEPLLHCIFELCKRANHQHVHYSVKGIVYLAQIRQEELHSVMQRREAILLCPFDDLSNGHAHVAAPAGQN